MKRLIIILLFCSQAVFATNYYVKNGGSDAADGLTDETAWATITKVKTMSFSPGDSIRFKCGSVWREYTNLTVRSGSSGNPITYTSYGEGDKPLFLGSKQENETTDWIGHDVNIWRNNDTRFATLEVCNIVFNDEESAGWRVFSIAELNAQGKWYYDMTSKLLYLYSTENPATYYSDIECVLKLEMLYVGNNVHVTLDGLAVKYSGRHGIAVRNWANNITIRNCDVTWIGGAISSGTVRLGNAIEFYGNCSNILVEQNFIENVYDAGISPQYFSKTFTITNFIVRYNIISKCDLSSIEFVWAVPSGSINGMYFDNNTCVDAGRGWAFTQRTGMTSSAGTNIRAADGSTVSYSNVYFRNNIFKNSIRPSLYCQQSWTVTEINYDYNLYNCDAIARIGYTGTIYTDLADWQTFSGEDPNSLSADPLLNADYTLQSESPAIDAGADLGYTYDYLGQEVPNGLLPDIGAIERYDEYPPIEPVIVTTIRPYWTSESTAVAGGSVTSTGGGTVSVRGVCWNTTGTPTTSDSKTEDGSGTGAYISLMTGLNNTLTYYVRAYAINEAGTSYGEELLFREGILLIDPDTGKPLVKDNKFITR